jgi:hypothetical protein
MMPLDDAGSGSDALANGTYTLTSEAGETVTVTVTVTAEGDRFRWDYLVHNDGFSQFGDPPGSVGVFFVVCDPTGVADVVNPAGWHSTFVIAGVDCVGWVADPGALLATGQDADFSFTTPACALGLVGANAWDENFTYVAAGQVLGPVQADISVQFLDAASMPIDKLKVGVR